MINRLEQLSVCRFVDLLCGDNGVLLTSEDEDASEKSLVMAMRDIVFEYRSIADPSGMRRYLIRAEKTIKAKISSLIFSMCRNLLALDEHERVREIMIDYGINARSMSAGRIEAEAKSRLARARRTLSELEKEAQEDKDGETDIRREFDEQTAALMAYFKFQIDPASMKATIYAHLIARHNQEIKARIASMSKK